MYKNISETAELKANYIRDTEKDEAPEHEESQSIIQSVAEHNETIQDLSRFECFKKWGKENPLGMSAIAISVAGIITTIVIGARKAITQSAQATGKFAKTVYSLGKKLGPLLAPLLNIISRAISWGSKGLVWLVSNLWVLAIALAWFIYDEYKQKKKKIKPILIYI